MRLDLARRYFLNSKAILFGIAVLNFVTSFMYVRQIELEIQARIGTGEWSYPEHWDPVAAMGMPLLLLEAAVFLVISRWWSLLLALLASGRVLYVLGFSSWRAVHAAHDVPMFSWQAVEKLWYVIYEPRPQYLFEVLLGGAICAYAILLLRRCLYSRSGGRWRLTVCT